jgi:hypothetical protein
MGFILSITIFELSLASIGREAAGCADGADHGRLFSSVQISVSSVAAYLLLALLHCSLGIIPRT